ncbi:hypothetical protein [Candidatus Phyllobacterium onerii]|uniref:hypothetical protein n=1 Tax=Candidatus Phyllobacterium onerii TaxID=3020828 RepID=UPI00232E1DA2|nr:hypothetical protein [Phyllobacterium sp. IY22]
MAAIRIAAFAAFVAAGSSVAAAEGIGGQYRSEGIDPADSHFSVTVEIEILAENTCRIKWSDGSKGICMLKGTTLSTAGIVHGTAQLGVYEVSSDGSIEGSFIDDYHGGGIGKGGKIGKEKMTPIR